MDERVLVTGGSGFVGAPLVDELATRGAPVYGCSRRAPAQASVPWFELDLLDVPAARALLRELKPACIVHAAWDVTHGRYWEDESNERWRDASTELAAAFFAGGGRRFVGIGTCAEYEPHGDRGRKPWPETRRLRPTTRYGQAKVALFEILQRLAASRPHGALAWARLFHLFGPGEKPERLVASLLRDLLAGREARCTGGAPVRDFASTWFAGRALAALLGSPVQGAVNIGSGAGRSVADMAQAVATAAGAAGLLRLGALPDRAGDPPSMVADTARLRSEVRFAELADVERDLRRLVAGLQGGAAADLTPPA